MKLKLSHLLNERITVSTWLTIGRILLTPVITALLLAHQWYAALLLFGVAALTDMLDGHLARVRNERTLLGACLDPLADKLLIISVFAAFAYMQLPYFAVPVWFLQFMVTKELILVAGVVALASAVGRISVRPSFLGKLTMLAQVLIIGVMLGGQLWAWFSPQLLYGAACVVTLLAAGSLIGYIWQGLLECFVRI